jgi:hypothetical protein
MVAVMPREDVIASAGAVGVEGVENRSGTCVDEPPEGAHRRTDEEVVGVSAQQSDDYSTRAFLDDGYVTPAKRSRRVSKTRRLTPRAFGGTPPGITLGFGDNSRAEVVDYRRRPAYLRWFFQPGGLCLRTVTNL